MRQLLTSWKTVAIVIAFIIGRNLAWIGQNSAYSGGFDRGRPYLVDRYAGTITIFQGNKFVKFDILGGREMGYQHQRSSLDPRDPWMQPGADPLKPYANQLSIETDGRMDLSHDGWIDHPKP